jgi:predicted kinase
MSTVLVITGAPASGKTTVGRRLARDLGVPYLSKDLFKETLFDDLGWQDRAWSKRLGGASMQLLYRCAAQLLEVGQSVALEANFYPQWDNVPLADLHERYGCQFVQLLCTAPGPLIWERFCARNVSGERHPGHVDLTRMDELRPILLAPWPPLELDGPLVTVDTTDFEAIDYDALKQRLSHHLAASESRR